MTIEQLRELIKERIQQIEKPYQRDRYYERCKEYVVHNKFTKIEEFLDVDIHELVRLYLLINNRDTMSEDECNELLDSIIHYFDQLSFENTSNVIGIINYIVECGYAESIVECIKEPDEKRLQSLLLQLDYEGLSKTVSDELSTEEKIKRFKELLYNLRFLQKDLDIVSIIKYYNEFNDTALRGVLELLEVRKKLEKDHASMEEAMQAYSTTFTSKTMRKAAKDYYKTVYCTRGILATHQQIMNYVNREEQKESKYNRDIQREKAGYQTAISLLETALLQPEITNARTIIKSVRSEELKKAFLEIIYQHNKKYYQQLEDRLNELKKNSINGYIARLKQASIIVNTNDAKMMMQHSMDELEEIFQIVRSLPLLDDEIKYILKTSNIQKIRQIKEYVDKGYMTPNFVCSNIKLWKKTNQGLNRIEVFYQTIQKWNLNPQLFCNSYEVLLDINHCVLQNMTLLEQYGFIKYLKNTNNLNFIANPQMIEKIDQMIEFGAVSFLMENMELINSDHIDRLSLLRQMHFEIDSQEELQEILFSKRFMIPDTDINQYISDESPKKSLKVLPSQLEEYRQDKYTYNIGDVLVSTKKVERLQSKGVELFQAIFHGLKVSEEELEKMLILLGKQEQK